MILSGWWFQPTPLKNDGVKVSWDDDIPNWMESHNPFMFQTNQVIIFNMFTDDFPIKTSIYNGKNNPFMFQTTNQLWLSNIRWTSGDSRVCYEHRWVTDHVGEFPQICQSTKWIQMVSLRLQVAKQKPLSGWKRMSSPKRSVAPYLPD